jgi:quinol monooxygenase YgiN
MLCALTVRTLKPGTFDQFRDAFMRAVDADDPPPGMVRFDMVRNVDAPDEVICFGLFDGTVDELRSLDRDDRAAQLAAIAPYVESTGADGIYEVVEELTVRSAAAI